MMKLFKGDGGLQALLGTKDFREAISRAEKGDKEADLIVRAFVYQVAKEIGAVSTVLKGEVECIAVTGVLPGRTILSVPLKRESVLSLPFGYIPVKRSLFPSLRGLFAS